MSKPAAPQLVRVLVDFYQGGQLLYKKDNVYPLDDRLQLLTARGEAQAYVSEAPIKPAKGKAATAVPKAAEPESTAAPTGETASAVTTASEAPSADAAGAADAATSDAVLGPGQLAADEAAAPTSNAQALP